MNEDKLKEFVTALDELSDDIKDWDVDMFGTGDPTCGTPGCHAGLVSIVAQELPEIQDIYTKLIKDENCYIYIIWAKALSEFLGFETQSDLEFSEENNLELWADDNPQLWGNECGLLMFSDAIAFTDDANKQLTHRDIIEHWKQVLANIEDEQEFRLDKEIKI